MAKETYILTVSATVLKSSREEKAIITPTPTQVLKEVPPQE